MSIPGDVDWSSTGQTLGSGGQGQVEVVTRNDQPNGPKYALKILRNVASLQARRRFRREIEVIKELNSPLIVRVIDHSEENDEFQFYAMDYHEGAKTLDSVIMSNSNPFAGKVTKCLDLFEQIVSAISECQASDPPIVHRDINPKNILVLPDGTIRLIDFGICQVQDGTMITLVDENVGARNYTSPECESGNDDTIGVHSDIYSAAKVLWSAMTSNRAFAREAAVFNERSMEQIFPTKSETWHLSHIFEKTIRQNPSDRVQRVDELFALIGEIRHIIEGGFSPLNEAVNRCPSCGFKNIVEFPYGHVVFGNPNPRGVKAVICNTCGFGFVRNVDIWQSNVDRLRDLS